MSETKSIEHPGWLTAGDFTDADEPLRLFGAWFAEAKRSEPVNPNAMALATVDADGSPNVRMVLLKDFDARGFVEVQTPVVVPSPGHSISESDLRDHCRKQLSTYKIPSKFAARSDDEIARTISNKVIKHLVRDDLMKREFAVKPA